ncbi:MAG TPA: thiamine pyrophosphate-dependent enzyme [Chloroflexota bacterium]|jgi:thiamine pyrophosphate-dependent acetolactate synthase large subunit-like protein
MSASAPAPSLLQRPDALRLIDHAFPEQPVVLTLGGTIREMLAVVGRRPNHLYLLDSMGLPVPIGIGLAVGLADEPAVERVVVVEGDGSLLMGFSVLSTIGLLRPKKLVVVVLDNSVYLATGGQPTAAATTDFVGAARACGYRAEEARGAAALEAALERSRAEDGPWLLRVPVGTEAPPTAFFLEDPVGLRAEFDGWLAGRRAGGTG